MRMSKVHFYFLLVAADRYIVSMYANNYMHKQDQISYQIANHQYLFIVSSYSITLEILNVVKESLLSGVTSKLYSTADPHAIYRYPAICMPSKLTLMSAVASAKHPQISSLHSRLIFNTNSRTSSPARSTSTPQPGPLSSHSDVALRRELLGFPILYDFP